MKTLVTALAMLAAGLGLGGALARFEDWRNPGQSLDFERILNPAAHPEDDSAQPVPRIVVDQPVFDFGSMDGQSEGNHGFVVKNVGRAPLTLALGSTTCKCTWSALKKETLQPGESTIATIKWTAHNFVGPFEQTARIETNDPARPVVALSIKGRVTTVLRASPGELIFGGLSVGDSIRGEALVFAYTTDKIKITGREMLEAETAQFFDIEVAPLSAEQLKAEKDAKSGVRVNVLVKPGLPPGPFHQTIRLLTDVSAAPTIDLVVRGKVGSDISILGPGWDDRHGQLRLGLVDREKGAQRRLHLVVRGQFRRAVEFKVLEVSPPGILEASLGQRQDVGVSGAARTPLTINIPKGTAAANHLGSGLGSVGYVLLETTHPQTPKIKILVSFAVEGG